VPALLPENGSDSEYKIFVCLIMLGEQTSVGVPWSSIALVSLMASQQFFATGHQATIAGIQWSAAFHGFPEDHTTIWLPALLVSLNTFASHILSTLTLPLLVYWPFTRGRWMAAAQSKKVVGQEKGEFLLNVKGGEEVKGHVYLLIVRFMLLSAIKVWLQLVTSQLCVFNFHLLHALFSVVGRSTQPGHPSVGRCSKYQ